MYKMKKYYIKITVLTTVFYLIFAYFGREFLTYEGRRILPYLCIAAWFFTLIICWYECFKRKY